MDNECLLNMDDNIMSQSNVENIFYDCHIHIPIKKPNSVKQLLKEIDANALSGFLLILNSIQEEDTYLKHIRLFNERNHKVALFLDIHSEYCLDNFRKLEYRGIDYVVKIHPRRNRITKSDFALIKEKLGMLHYHTIIVDDWIFGCQTDNHIGTELSMYLAKELPNKNVVIAHAGGYRVIETMLLTRPIQNIYYDLSLTQIYFRGASIEADVDYFIKWTSGKILFGSDYPEFAIGEAWHSFKQHFYNAGRIHELGNTAMLAQKIYGLE